MHLKRRPGSLEVLCWTSAALADEGTVNLPAFHSLMHRFTIEPKGDLNLCHTIACSHRMRYLGAS